MDLFKSDIRALTVAAVSALAAACLPIDRTPLEATPGFADALVQADRVNAIEAQPLSAGAGRVDMTPPGAPPLAGYGNRLGRPLHGVHDRVYARALALRAGDRTLVLISLDLLAVTDDMVTAIERRIRQSVPLPPDSLIVTATHTHSSFGGVALRVWESFAAGEYDPEVFALLTQRAAQAAISALYDLAAAELAWGEAQAPDRIANRMVSGGYTDPSIPFLAVRRPDGEPVAMLVNFSAHATVLKADNVLLSGDFPGAMARSLETSQGVTLFTAGAVADQTGVPPPGADRFEAMEAMGNDLAARVREARLAIAESAWSHRVALGSWRLDVRLPPAQIKVSPGRRLPRPVGSLFFDRDTTLTMAVIGDGVLIGVPCDLSAGIGATWKAEAARLGRRAVILGFANDYVGYVIPSEYYQTSHYEARMSFNGPYMDRYFSALIARGLARLGPAAVSAR